MSDPAFTSLPDYPELDAFRERFAGLTAEKQGELLQLAERLRPYHKNRVRRADMTPEQQAEYDLLMEALGQDGEHEPPDGWFSPDAGYYALATKLKQFGGDLTPRIVVFGSAEDDRGPSRVRRGLEEARQDIDGMRRAMALVDHVVHAPDVSQRAVDGVAEVWLDCFPNKPFPGGLRVANWLEALDSLSRVRAALDAHEATESVPRTPNAPPPGKSKNGDQPPDGPAVYLTSWNEILAALEQKGRAGQAKVRALHKQHAGPIIMPGKGGQPRVERRALLSWWEGISQRWEELRQRQQDRKATTESTHAYGRSGTVRPASPAA